MCRSLLITLAGWLLAFSPVLADDGEPQGRSRFRCEKDSIDYLRNVGMTREYVCRQEYKKAYQPWKDAMASCPQAQACLYSDGVKILHVLLQAETDSAKHSMYLTELMDLYDKNIRYKKDLDRFVSKPMRRDYLLATKAYDYLHYAGSALDLHRAYTLVCDALESVEDRPLCYLLLTWMDVNLRIYRADSSFKDTYLKDYQNAVSLIRRSYEASGAEERRMWNETLALVNDMFRESGLAGQLTAQAAEPLAYNKEEKLLR